MNFSEVKVGMIFDNNQPPRFLFVNSKRGGRIQVIGIDSSIPVGDPAFECWDDEMTWDDYFTDAELTSPDNYRTIIRYLLK